MNFRMFSESLKTPTSSLREYPEVVFGEPRGGRRPRRNKYSPANNKGGIYGHRASIENLMQINAAVENKRMVEAME